MGKIFRNIFIAIKDIINFFVFRREMKILDIGSDEEFKNLKLKRNWLGNVVYAQIDCSDRELVDADYSIYDLSMKKMQPYIDFFNKLKWSEYLVPEIANLQDEDGEITLSFLFLFVYRPIVFTFWKLIVFLMSLGLLSVLIYFVIWCIGTYM